MGVCDLLTWDAACGFWMPSCESSTLAQTRLRLVEQLPCNPQASVFLHFSRLPMILLASYVMY